MMDKEYAETVAWSGMCETCLTCVVLYPHPEASVADAALLESGSAEWGTFPACYVCDGRIEWNGTDPVKSVIR